MNDKFIKLLKTARSVGRIEAYKKMIEILNNIDISNPILLNTLEVINDEIKILLEKEKNE